MKDLQENLKNPNVRLHRADLIKTLGDLEVYSISYSRDGRKSLRRAIGRYSNVCEGIMAHCNGVYGIGKTIRGARRNFLKKLGFVQ